MNAHNDLSPILGPDMLPACSLRVARIGYIRAVTFQMNTQISPAAPVIQNAARQPNASAMGVTSNGVRMAPSEPPLYPILIPRACLSAGSVSALVLIAP